VAKAECATVQATIATAISRPCSLASLLIERVASTAAFVNARQAVRQVALTVCHYTVSIQQRRAWTADSCFPGGDARITLRAIPGPSGMTRPQLARFRAKIWRSLRAA
jgi:hypothetical protein